MAGYRATTVARFDAHTGAMIDADIFLNGRTDLALLSESNPDAYFDLGSVMTHELGHVLGLDESTVPSATMWPTTARASSRQRTLADDDEQGLVAIYGESGAEHAMYGCAVGSRRVDAPWTVFACGWAMAVGLRMRRVKRR